MTWSKHSVRTAGSPSPRSPASAASWTPNLIALKEQPLDHTVFPYVFLDATYCKARVNHRIVSLAVAIATGISATGHREILGLMVGDSESKPFWTKFLRSLRARGLDNVQLVVSDSHSGLVAAIRTVFLGAAWQRCRVH